MYLTISLFSLYLTNFVSHYAGCSSCSKSALYKYEMLFHFHKVAYVQYLGEMDMFLPRCMECRRGLAMRILSVCPSVTRVHCDKTEERSVQIFIPYERIFILVF